MSARSVRSAVVAAAATRIAFAALRAHPPAGERVWSRSNHRGEPVTLLEGPAVAVGAVAGVLAAGGASRDQLAAALAGMGAAAFGGYDDLAGDGASRGFRGHLTALRGGRLTTGTVKLAGIGATGVAAALVADGRGGSRAARLADQVINAGLVAGAANLVNLFDLRPGRAIKAAGLAGALLAAAPGGAAAAAPPLAAAAALLPEDLGERAMLGDAGANAIGAMLGVAAATSLPRRARVAALAVIVGLTAASEVVSFTQVIEQTGPLRWLDMLGRRPASGAEATAHPAAPAAQARAADGGGADDPAAPSPAPATRRPARVR